MQVLQRLGTRLFERGLQRRERDLDRGREACTRYHEVQSGKPS